jgi:hypothetical protein
MFPGDINMGTLALQAGGVSEPALLYGWWFTASKFVLAKCPLRPMTRILIFQLKVKLLVVSLKGLVASCKVTLALSSLLSSVRKRGSWKEASVWRGLECRS